MQDLLEPVGILPGDQVAIGRQRHRLAESHRGLAGDVLLWTCPRPPGAASRIAR